MRKKPNKPKRWRGQWLPPYPEGLGDDHSELAHALWAAKLWVSGGEDRLTPEDWWAIASVASDKAGPAQPAEFPEE